MHPVFKEYNKTKDAEVKINDAKTTRMMKKKRLLFSSGEIGQHFSRLNRGHQGLKKIARGEYALSVG